MIIIQNMESYTLFREKREGSKLPTFPIYTSLREKSDPLFRFQENPDFIREREKQKKKKKKKNTAHRHFDCYVIFLTPTIQKK